MNHNSPEYRAYIYSSAWRARRVDYYSRHPKVCAACGSENRIHLHHMTYARFTREADVDLVPLCEKCHDTVHKYAREQRRKSLVLITIEHINRTKHTFPATTEVVAREPRQRNGSRSRGDSPRARRTNRRSLEGKRKPATSVDKERRRQKAAELNAAAQQLANRVG